MIPNIWYNGFSSYLFKAALPQGRRPKLCANREPYPRRPHFHCTGIDLSIHYMTGINSTLFINEKSMFVVQKYFSWTTFLKNIFFSNQAGLLLIDPIFFFHIKNKKTYYYDMLL